MMDRAPTLSVVMSVYNAESYLRKAVDSVLDQTFKDFEFIIIDDCSTDNSLQILEAYAQKDNRITLIKKDRNKGAEGFIENLNLGLQKSKGKYIARMDADDISVPERFEKQLIFLDSDPELFMVGSSLEMIDENDNFIKILTALPDDVAIKKAMFKNIALYHPSLMFRNDNIHYREKMQSCEDYDLFFRLMLAGKKMANIPEPLLRYRVLPASMSRKDKTFVRWLMVEKARLFYRESQKTGKDSYDKFCPDDMQNILEKNYKNELEDLIFAAKTALVFHQKQDLKIILEKIERFYPQKATTKYRLALWLPDSFLKIYSKILF